MKSMLSKQIMYSLLVSSTISTIYLSVVSARTWQSLSSLVGWRNQAAFYGAAMMSGLAFISLIGIFLIIKRILTAAK